MFKSITGFSKNGIPQPYVDERFQYFHHYWGIVKHSNSDLFFEEIWFESHRSIITKIEYQFEHNSKESYKWFRHLFLNHPFFEKSNILAKNRTVQKYVRKIKNQVDPKGTTGEKQKGANYRIHQTNIEQSIKKIKSKLLERQEYSKVLAKSLTSILSENLPLSKGVKSDIRFLVVAFIVELYAFGYNLKYIERIPDIILFSDKLDEFPYEKTSEDFDEDEKSYEAYKEEERKSVTMEKCLSGLLNLINRPIKDGYYIFKVENIILLNPQPVTIGEVTFYNPNVSLMQNLSSAKEEWKKQYMEAEYFYSPLPNEEFDETKRSACNAIIKSKIRSHRNIESPLELYQAFHTVSKSLEILCDIFGKYIVKYENNLQINLRNHIKLHGNKKIANFSFAIFNNGPTKVEIDIPEKIEDANFEVDFINRIDKGTLIGNKLFHIIATHSKLKNNEEFFNFKDLWIAWESLMTRQRMKEFTKEIYYIKYKKNYLLRIIQFLNLNLSEHNIFKSPAYWTLNNDELRKIGLSFDEGEKNYKHIFLAKNHLISSFVPIEIVKDVLKQVDNYCTNESQFFNDLNKWIERTIDEVFIERNMEVHKNLQNDLSSVKLKQDFLKISFTLYHEIIDYCDKRNPNSLDLVMKRIEIYKKSL